MAGSRAEAEKDNVVVPLTLEDYCIKSKPPGKLTSCGFILYCIYFTNFNLF